MIEVENCPLCGANSFKEVFSAPYFRGNNELFKIQECNSCKLWFTSPRPADSDLGKYYEAEDYISHTDKKEGVIDRIYHLVRTYSLGKKLALINSINNGSGSLMDYGAGTGYFASKAKAAGWEVEGVEPSQVARDIAEKRDNIRLYDPEQMQWENGKYDVITLWHVLEHLPNLKEHLAKFSEALKEGGALIIAVPNHESYDSEYYGNQWAALDVPLHLYHFKKENIKRLGEEYGLSLEKIHNMPFDSFYVSLLSEKIKNGKQNYLKAFLTGLKSNLKGISGENASSLIYVLRKPQKKA